MANSNLKKVILEKNYYITVIRDIFDISSETADNYFSETLYNLLRKGIDDKYFTKPYIKTCVKNLTIDKLRIKNRLYLNNDLEKFNAINNDKVEYSYKTIRNYIYQLNSTRKTVLILKFGFNLTHEEISLFLDIPFNTAKSRIFIAQHELKILIINS